jgi:hypothetical protein
MNPYREVLEDELRDWPDVFWEIEAGGKHDKVVLYVGMNRRFYPISKGATAGRGSSRATMNMRSDLRKLLREMGAVPA